MAAEGATAKPAPVATARNEEVFALQDGGGGVRKGVRRKKKREGKVKR